jgi:hypothetical protein
MLRTLNKNDKCGVTPNYLVCMENGVCCYMNLLVVDERTRNNLFFTWCSPFSEGFSGLDVFSFRVKIICLYFSSCTGVLLGDSEFIG